LLDPLIRRANAAGVPIVLLHCAPWERQAGYLSSIHPLVFADVSLAVTRSGAQAREVLSRALSWTPFNRLLYASDGVGVAETQRTARKGAYSVRSAGLGRAGGQLAGA